MYGIFTYIWVIFRANVGKYSVHGAYGYSYPTFHHIWTLYSAEFSPVDHPTAVHCLKDFGQERLHTQWILSKRLQGHGWSLGLGKLDYFTNLNSSAIRGWLPLHSPSSMGFGRHVRSWWDLPIKLGAATNVTRWVLDVSGTVTLELKSPWELISSFAWLRQREYMYVSVTSVSHLWFTPILSWHKWIDFINTYYSMIMVCTCALCVPILTLKYLTTTLICFQLLNDVVATRR